MWNIDRLGPGVFAARNSEIAPSARLVGPLWIGRGQRVGEDAVVIGPRVLPDLSEAEESKNQTAPVATVMVSRAPAAATESYALKRPLDLILAGLGLLISLPLWPFIIAAIVIEGGGKPFFVDRRQSKGGRPFSCLKFRSLRPENKTDDSQTPDEKDSRLTRVGSVLRRYHLDKLPQLLNVISGDMSLVGPRPSPDDENQYCPAWRDARLSVRPGLTGIWRVNRTRAIGNGFMDWIRDDLEYLEAQSLFLDLKIILKTIRQILAPDPEAGDRSAGLRLGLPRGRDAAADLSVPCESKAIPRPGSTIFNFRRRPT